MAEFTKQGTLSTTGTIIYTGTSNSFLSKISTIRIHNPAAYVITLDIYNAATASTTNIYTVTLSAGDTLTDSFNYALGLGDQLIITSDIAGSTYYAYIVSI